MDLSLQSPGDHLYVRAVSGTHIQVGEEWLDGAVVLSASTLLRDWPARDFGALQAEHLEALFDLQPELVLLGTGASQRFLEPALMMAFFTRGIGIEVMPTAAACRTFNVLVSEGRRVVAGLFPPGY